MVAHASVFLVKQQLQFAEQVEQLIYAQAEIGIARPTIVNRLSKPGLVENQTTWTQGPDQPRDYCPFKKIADGNHVKTGGLRWLLLYIPEHGIQRQCF